MSTSLTVMDRPARTPGRGRRGARPGVALAVIVTCQLMLVLDGTVVNIALPQIQEALRFSATGLSWVLNAYLLPFGGLLLLGGRAGDVLGRRRVFGAGILLFTLASLLGGLAPAAGWLVAARAAQGVGAAFAAPSALAFIATTFAEGAARNRALALYSAVAGAGGSLGLLLGGMLTAWASWRWVLFINVPVGAAVVLLAPRVIPEAPRRPGQLDLAGALSSTVGMAALVYGFIRASAHGWGDRPTLGAFAVAVVLLALFLAVEARVGQPLLPLRLFADRTRAGAYLNMLLFFATLFGVFFFLTQFLQDVLGFSPLGAGLAFLPMTLAMFATVRAIPRLLPRVGPKPIVVAGAALIAGGLAWLTRVSPGSGYAADLLGPLLLLGVGVGSTVMPLNVVILAGVRAEDSGAASGALQTMQQVGGALGLALLVTVFGAASRAAAGQPPAGAAVRAQAASVLAHGIGGAFTAGALFAVAALAVAVVAIRATPARA
ncbi:MAG TPA: MFS transporter, partial [Thermomicrobiales bacterium]|nr:MFS transporter [Thermomicrobiales bacterium]